MRRSKSDPAKYARNYRKISQRRMTQYDHIDEEKEMERLRSILRNSQDHLKEPNEEDKRKKKRKIEVTSDTGLASDEVNTDDIQSSILSKELLTESGHYSAENPLIVLPTKKKKKAKRVVQLSPEEIREAKAIQKKTAKKLQQLEARAAQKKRRAELYKTLEQHQVSKSALSLLSSSGNVSRKETSTKKQTLQKLLNKERAGISLNNDEKALLYPEVVVDDDAFENKGSPTKLDTERIDEKLNQIGKKEKKVKSQERKYRAFDDNAEDSIENLVDGRQPTEKVTPKEEEEEEDMKTEESTATGFDFAAQMMASLSKLKADTAIKSTEEVNDESNTDEIKDVAPHKKYTPTAPTILKTAASMGIHSSKLSSSRKAMPITRPSLVEKLRYDLPVSAMEFEIMDSIRNNDVTIICGETGSGKSTQVPQFLYEAGMCLNESDTEKRFLIGITQPRRVAAVSTAKRVCYEMGKGDGQTIRAHGKGGNLVSYKTRYETAGTGTNTCIQFMTDGILLQEIQSDLLLRRYSVIVLDESHERNLNTDVLIGLLSKTIPLRKKAAEEDPTLVPLKLVLMSATLRVEDFTKNPNLFPSGAPSVVKVPGRTFPVSIHHSKVTELDDYGKLLTFALLSTVNHFTLNWL